MDANNIIELLRQYMAIDDIEEVWRYAMWTDMALRLPITDDMWYESESKSANHPIKSGKWIVELHHAFVDDTIVAYARNNELSLAICEAWLKWRMAQDE